KDVLPAIDLIYNKQLKRTDAAHSLSVKKSAIEGMLRNNLSFLRSIIKNYQPDMEAFFVEWFLQNPRLNYSYEFLLYGDLFRYFPSPNNLRILKTIKKKYPHLYKFLNDKLSGRQFLPLDEAVHDHLFKTDVEVLTFFTFLFSAYEEFIILPVDGIYCITRYSEEIIAWQVFNSFSTPMSYDEFLQNRSKLLGSNLNEFFIKSAPKDLTVFPYVYMLDEDLYGTNENLSYPDSSQIIDNSKKHIEENNGLIESHLLYEKIKADFPLLRSYHEFLSVLKGCTGIMIKNSHFILDKPLIESADKESKREYKRIRKNFTQYINRDDKLFPSTALPVIIAYMKWLKPETVIEVLRTSPFFILQNDAGFRFIVNSKWSKAKIMFCIAYNFKNPVKPEVMRSLFDQMEKELKEADFKSTFGSHNKFLHFIDGAFRISEIDPRNHMNYSKT
ncbi:MAG: hypothetical protein ACM3RX_05740, partial [Methanococcaceae archaeon]